MRVLVTAGNTQAPVDRVRCVTNIFTGRTGATIALECARRGHAVTLLTSHPETVGAASNIEVEPFRTFDELADSLARRVPGGAFDAIVHSAAVSDHRVAGVYAPAAGTSFDPLSAEWAQDEGTPPALVDRAAGKVKSDAPELWLRLVRAPKLVDRVRAVWGFAGVLVKFKLEVGLTDEALREVAERSRVQSGADWMVANTLERSADWALVGPYADGYRRVARAALAAAVADVIERGPGGVA